MTASGTTRLLFALASMAGIAGHAPAQPVTITFSAQEPGSVLGLADGSGELPVESLVRVGYFSIPHDQVLARLDTPSLLEPSFTQLASTRIGYFGGFTGLDNNGAVFENYEEPGGPNREGPGLFAHSLTYDPEAMGLRATQFYLWVVDTPVFEDATEFGLFSHSGWTSSPNTPGESIYEVNQVNPFDPMDLLHADRGPELSSIAGFGPLNKLRAIEGMPVPEPALPALLLAAAAWIGWQRRRSGSLLS